MQDNHSFDNYFGTYPGADSIPGGVCQRVSLNRKSTRGCVQPFHLGNAAIEDLSQGPAIQERQYNKGRMDGFVAAYRRLGQDGPSAMGYYDGTDIPFHWNVADQYVLFDRFFASTAIGSREAYLYWLAGTAPTAQTACAPAAIHRDAVPTPSPTGTMPSRIPSMHQRPSAKSASQNQRLQKALRVSVSLWL
jgi:phospholipase C